MVTFVLVLVLNEKEGKGKRKDGSVGWCVRCVRCVRACAVGASGVDGFVWVRAEGVVVVDDGQPLDG